MNTDNLIQNMISAAKLDVNFFNAVEHDESKNGEALTVVIIAAVASALGNGIGGIFSNGIVGGLMGALFGLLMVIVGYYLWSYLTHFIGVKFFNGEAEVGEVLRTFGYSYSPQVLTVLAFIPCVGWAIALIAGIWSLVAGIVAIREAMDFDTGKAVLTALIAWVIMIVLFLIVGTVFGVGAVGAGAIMGR
jgi:hypothetical protein